MERLGGLENGSNWIRCAELRFAAPNCDSLRWVARWVAGFVRNPMSVARLTEPGRRDSLLAGGLLTGLGCWVGNDVPLGLEGNFAPVHVVVDVVALLAKVIELIEAQL